MSQRTRKKNFDVLCAIFVSFVFLFVSARSTRAWDDGGHMLVAQIAFSQMSAEAKSKASALVEQLPDVRRSTTALKPRAYDFVTAACWMDDIKSSSQYDSYRSWHYINPVEGAGVLAAAKPNVLTAIDESRELLRHVEFGNIRYAIALGVLIHTVGDLHQPLHATGRDMGGNTFPILGVRGLENSLRSDGKSVDKTQPVTGANTAIYQRLHAFWDSAYRYDIVGPEKQGELKMLYSLGSSSRPDLENIPRVATEIIENYRLSGRPVPQLSGPVGWAQESNRLALTFALSTPRGRKPSDEYFIESHDTACAQIALAGYRLAQLLNAIF